ncbi:glycoside hydrolase family 28 protein [Arachidicoccus sp.]|uniref:glycoside hydrolase family 28 protein n=1 Tax=Arachidicoccus sp. TaxID=1872624 RepID=UPI003D258E2D
MNFKQIRMIAAVFLLSFGFFMQASAQENLKAEIEKYVSAAPFKMTAPVLPNIPDISVDITSFGAVGDGHTLNTEAITKAIDECARRGGGKVTIPPGLWLTGPIELKSKINLHVELGAILLFTKDHSLFPIIASSAKSRTFFVKNPIYGYKLHDVAITGKGILNGSGDSWRPIKKEKTTEGQWKNLLKQGGIVSADGKMWWPTKEAMDGEAYIKKIQKEHKQVTADDLLPARDFLRPYMVSLVNCSKVLIDGPTFMNSPKFALFPKYCDNLIIRDVKINNEWYAQNGDGIDISNSQNVIIYKCTVSTGDDGICMKSSRPSSDKTDTACLKNILIADCIVYHAHGGFVIGSNTDGGMENISVSNCNYINTDIGIRVKSNRGRGGLVHQIYIDNVYMNNIADEAVAFNTYYEQKAKPTGDFQLNATTPRFQDFYLNNIYCVGASTAISLTGLPEMPVNHLYFSNINITAKKGYEAVDAKDISFKNVTINDHELRQ